MHLLLPVCGFFLFTVSLTVQYTTLYISYNEMSMNMSDMYETTDRTKAGCQQQCTVDDRCKAYVVFENDQNNSTCGLSENQDYFSVTNCTTCSVNLKHCSSGKIFMQTIPHHFE